jgi:HAMP domain-containing protein
MIMKSRDVLSVMIALTLAAFVVSAWAQDAGPARRASDLSADSAPTVAADVRGAGSPESRPGADNLLASPTSEPTVDPALGKFGTEEAALRRQADLLIRQLEAADSDALRQDIKAKLGETLSKQFDASQKRYGIEIEALEAQIKRLKDLVRKRQENRAEIISRRLDQIVRDSQGLGF